MTMKKNSMTLTRKTKKNSEKRSGGLYRAYYKGPGGITSMAFAESDNAAALSYARKKTPADSELLTVKVYDSLGDLLYPDDDISTDQPEP